MATITIAIPEAGGPPVYDVAGEIGVATFVGVLEIVKASVLVEAAGVPPPPIGPRLELPNGNTLLNLRGR